ncbi:hypothetical protein OEZ81_26360, partial [Leclercia adecarboxylata]
MQAEARGALQRRDAMRRPGDQPARPLALQPRRQVQGPLGQMHAVGADLGRQARIESHQQDEPPLTRDLGQSMAHR